jgi:hypothetical protein
MAIDLENSKEDLKSNLDWLYLLEYLKPENHATEALFKWFFFSRPPVQRVFLMKMCGIPASRAKWGSFSLQRAGQSGTPDAIVDLQNGSKVLFEVKIKPKSISRGQLRRHLDDAGLKRRPRPGGLAPKLILITPDFRPPEKLRDLPSEYQSAIIWIPWHEVIVGFLERLRGLNSMERLLRDALVLYLKEYIELKRFFT